MANAASSVCVGQPYLGIQNEFTVKSRQVLQSQNAPEHCADHTVPIKPQKVEKH